MAGNISTGQLVSGDWLSRQRRLTQIYCRVVADLNDNGIFPAGREVQRWIREQFSTIKEPTRDEIANVLTALIQEKAITQADIDHLNKCAALSSPASK
jgi:hypothetical protein